MNKRYLFTIAMILLLITQMMSPVTVFADDGTPPVETAETPPPEAGDETPEEKPEEEAEPVEDLTVAEVLEQTPDGTEVVVINDVTGIGADKG